MTRVRAVLLDLEGTLYANSTVIDGAVDAVAALRRSELPVRFLTNTDSRTVAQLRCDLAAYGLDVAPDELFTPVVAAERLLVAAGASTFALLSTELLAELPTVAPHGPYTHVLIGDCRETLDYSRLDQAFWAVRCGAELLALQRGRYFRRTDRDHIDTGAVVAAIEYSTGVTARVLGKPSEDFFRFAAASLGRDAEECVVVGDDASTDVRGGRAAGMRTVQVRTGKFADQLAAGSTGEADHEIASVADLPALLSELGAA